jgi:DNA invertase Pin-like site-specific DNA recombinase
MKAAIYARGASSSSQIDQCRAYAEEHRYTVEGEYTYVDPLRSGLAPLEESPELVKFFYAATAGKFDILLAKNAACISRNQQSLDAALSYLARFGVQVIFLDEQVVPERVVVYRRVSGDGQLPQTSIEYQRLLRSFSGQLMNTTLFGEEEL